MKLERKKHSVSRYFWPTSQERVCANGLSRSVESCNNEQCMVLMGLFRERRHLIISCTTQRLSWCAHAADTDNQHRQPLIVQPPCSTYHSPPPSLRVVRVCSRHYEEEGCCRVWYVAGGGGECRDLHVHQLPSSSNPTCSDSAGHRRSSSSCLQLHHATRCCFSA